jgi:hypothetical protein
MTRPGTGISAIISSFVETSRVDAASVANVTNRCRHDPLACEYGRGGVEYLLASGGDGACRSSLLGLAGTHPATRTVHAFFESFRLRRSARPRAPLRNGRASIHGSPLRTSEIKHLSLRMANMPWRIEKHLSLASCLLRVQGELSRQKVKTS